MPDYDRRRFLRLGSIATVGALAGCAGGDGGGDATTTTPDATTRETTATATTDELATTGTTTGGETPGADEVGGPDDLRTSVTVEARALSADRGAGRFVFSPAVAWVEPGSTVTWTIESGSHSITAYHPHNDGKPARVPEAAESFDSGLRSAGGTYEHTFAEPGVYNYYCSPHEGLGMVGLVVVGEPAGGPGTTTPDDVESTTASQRLSSLLSLAGVQAGGGQAAYGWTDATWDSYWYSLYTMSTNISMSANGVLFPHNDDQQAQFDERLPAMLEHADVEKPPIVNPNLNMAPFTEGDPHFTREPVFDAGDGRPDASTLRWDPAESSKVVSPASVAWTHLKGVTWARNFEAHFDTLPADLAAKFRAQVLTTLAQIGTNATLIAGGPDGNGALTRGDGLELVSAFRPGDGTVVDETARPTHHAAMLWFLSGLAGLANEGWFGYVNPGPLIPAAKIQQLTDGVAAATMDQFSPADVIEAGSTRDHGLLLGALGWYGTHAGSDDRESRAATYADDLAAAVAENTAESGRVDEGARNQAATQGAVGQGLLWASQVSGVDHADLAGDVLEYLFAELWDAEAGTFASDVDADTYTITARDAGDVTGGVNAADAVLEREGVKEVYATFFDQTLNRGRLQRAERPPSRDASAEHALPLPPDASGAHGQAAVYNARVTYDTASDEWTVDDDRFYTGPALYLANQEIWLSQWGGDFYEGRGVPGGSDGPP